MCTLLAMVEGLRGRTRQVTRPPHAEVRALASLEALVRLGQHFEAVLRQIMKA
jgi:hypothetical protein